MVGYGSGRRRHGLDNVEPVRLLVVVADAASRGELAGVTKAGGTAGEEIGIERNDDLGVRLVVVRIGRSAKRELRSGARFVSSSGLPLVPLSMRIQLLDRCELRGHGRRRDGLGEDAETCAARGALPGVNLAEAAEEIAPGADFVIK